MSTSDTLLLELMASKICHDLISPVGAVSNGVEILEEMGADAGEDVTSLISYSAGQANAKLKTMRMAYGLGGAEEGIKPEEVHATFEAFIAGEKRLNQSWDPYADLGLERKKGFAKILMCTLMMAHDALPKGGLITVEKDADGIAVVKGEGDNAHFRDRTLDALTHTMETDSLDPKLIHPYITGLLAKKYNYPVEAEENGDDIIFLRIKSSNVL